MEPTAIQSDVPPSTAEDLDLYCLNCSYNLRGLAGDPRRCPECFALTPVDKLAVTPELVEQQLQMMLTEPTICVICLAGALLATAVVLYDVIAVGLAANPPDLPCFSVLLAFCVLGVGGMTALVRANCNAAPGWGMAFIRYQLVGLVLLTFAILAVMGVAAAVQAIGARVGMRYPSVPRAILQTFMFAIVMAAAYPIARRVTRRVGVDLLAFQHAAAVKRARNFLRLNPHFRR